MKRKIIQNITGFSALVLLAVLVGSVFLNTEPEGTPSQPHNSSGSIIFEDDELVFDGTSNIDLMKGVQAKDCDGNDATDKVEAIITGDGTLYRKTVRYTFVDVTGRIITRKRTLVMKNYTGPSLYVKNPLYLESQDIKDLINVLKNNGWLTAEDGYGRDITASVRCLREKIADEQYEFKFNIINAYQDLSEMSVKAFIQGDVRDPEIRLSDTSVTIRKTDYFDPAEYIVYSFDGHSENVADKINIDSSVDVSKSGDYRVVYRLYSADKTAITTKVLKVRVEL